MLDSIMGSTVGKKLSPKSFKERFVILTLSNEDAL